MIRQFGKIISQSRAVLWLDNPILIIFLGKQSQEFPKKLGKLIINYFLPKLLVTYGMHHHRPIMHYWLHG